MATYKAEIKTVPTGSSYTVTVESGSISTAKQEIEHLYDPIYIRNLRQVSSGSSSSGGGDGEGYVWLIGLLFAVWLISNYWMFIAPVAAIILGGSIIKWFKNW
jgi:hypothetical protein